MIAGTQCLFKMFVVDQLLGTSALTYLQFGLLVIATVCIAAAGYIINDIEDTKADEINKPEKMVIGKGIKEKTAFILYMILNIVGVLLGIYLANMVGNRGLAIIFVAISGMLYAYATQVKGIVIVGNMLVSILIVMAIVIIGVFDVSPVQQVSNHTETTAIFSILYTYALFAFLVNFIREVIKDAEDVEGDHVAGIKTLPIVLGRQRAVRITSILAVTTAAVIFYFVYQYLYDQPWAVGYVLLLVIAPLLYFSFKAWQLEDYKELTTLSTLLKLIMLLGILSVAAIYFIVQWK